MFPNHFGANNLEYLLLCREAFVVDRLIEALVGHVSQNALQTCLRRNAVEDHKELRNEPTPSR